MRPHIKHHFCKRVISAVSTSLIYFIVGIVLLNMQKYSTSLEIMFYHRDNVHSTLLIMFYYKYAFLCRTICYSWSDIHLQTLSFLLKNLNAVIEKRIVCDLFIFLYIDLFSFSDITRSVPVRCTVRSPYTLKMSI